MKIILLSTFLALITMAIGLSIGNTVGYRRGEISGCVFASSAADGSDSAREKAVILQLCEMSLKARNSNGT